MRSLSFSITKCVSARGPRGVLFLAQFRRLPRKAIQRMRAGSRVIPPLRTRFAERTAHKRLNLDARTADFNDPRLEALGVILGIAVI